MILYSSTSACESTFSYLFWRLLLIFSTLYLISEAFKGIGIGDIEVGGWWAGVVSSHFPLGTQQRLHLSSIPTSQR